MMGEIKMFEYFSEEEKKGFAEMEHSVIDLDKNENVITEGELSRSLYLLLKGTCLITRTSDQAKIRLSKLVPGEIFGEMSFFSDQPRQSTVTAIEKVKVLKMDDDFFKKVNPEVRDRIKDYLIELLINRLDKMNVAIMKISKLMRA